MQQSLQTLETDWSRQDPRATGHVPQVFCALAFDPEAVMQGAWQGLPNSLLLLPALQLHRERGSCSLSFNCDTRAAPPPEGWLAHWMSLLHDLLAALARPRATPATPPLYRQPAPTEQQDWLQLVAQAIRDIHAGELEKVVAARHVHVHTNRGFQAAPLVERLARLYPDCVVLAIHLNNRTVVAATPERLLAVANGELRCDALGGTGARGVTQAEDRRKAQALLNDRKARHEHALVVSAIDAALTPLCQDLRIPLRPELVRLHNLQHLHTAIRGRLAPGLGLLDAVARLHPTPAVAGAPTVAACAWLRRHETLERGWYSGATGWLSPGGEGELSVLLRCAVLQGSQADLFAGAGIVAQSDPATELEETEMKLRAMLDVMEPAPQASPASPPRRASCP